jgi:hypothetical protein
MQVSSTRPRAASRASAKKNTTMLAKFGYTAHPHDMIPVNVLSAKLHEALVAQAANKSSELGRLSEKAIIEITTVCANVLHEISNFQDNSIIDPVSGLVLPVPQPEVLFRDRHKVPRLHRSTAEEFVQLTSWNDYRQADILAVDFIRARDVSLYNGLHYQAKRMNVSMDEYLTALNILSRYTMMSPPSHKRDRVHLVRTAIGLMSAEKALSTAQLERFALSQD